MRSSTAMIQISDSGSLDLGGGRDGKVEKRMDLRTLSELEPIIQLLSKSGREKRPEKHCQGFTVKL